MKAPVRRTTTKTQLGQKKRRDAYCAFIYRTRQQERAVCAGVTRALQTDHPGCPKQVFLGLVSLEAYRISKTSRRRRVTPRELTAAVVLVLRVTRALAAA